jgi:Niemann-Pick C1 protein
MLDRTPFVVVTTLTVILLSSMLNVSLADDTCSPVPSNFTARPGYCTWYGQCRNNPVTGKPFNCYYNGPAKDPSGNQELMTLLKDYCPWLVNTTNPLVCCSEDQVKTLKDQTQVARNLFSRCPACINNFMKHICHMTCDPNMSLFIEPVYYDEGKSSTVMQCKDSHGSITEEYLDEVALYYDPTYGAKLFNSCSNVVYPEQSSKVIDIMCGGVPKCNPQAWLAFMGDPKLDYNQAPFRIRYVPTTHPAYENSSSLDLSLVNCYDDGDFSCSCSDCPKVCPLPPVNNQTDGRRFKIYFSIGSASVGFCITLGVVVLSIIATGLTYILKDIDTNDDLGSSSSSASINDDNEDIKWDDFSTINPLCSPCYVLSYIGAWLELCIKKVFYMWGYFCSKCWFIVLPLSVLMFGGLIGGVSMLNIVTDPVHLWSAPDSRARLEKNYFDQNFSPFYRTEQVIITTKPGITGFTYYQDTNVFNFGPVFNAPVLLEAFNLQLDLMKISAPYNSSNGTFIKNIELSDICFKPLYPDNNECTIESIFNYFQNNMTRFNYTEMDPNFHMYPIFNASYHIHYCTRNPTATLENNFKQKPEGQFPCLGAYGGPVDPNTALGGFNGTDFDTASALLMTFIVSNHVDEEKNAYAEAWEKAFLAYLKNYKGEYINVAYTAERAITDEIDRESSTDILTIGLSYLFMFIYIALFLGHIRSLTTLLVDLKIMLGLFGVLIVLIAVGASLGFLSLCGVEASLIIIEVVPFLVLAVGVDNLFILVHAYEREERKTPHCDVNTLIGRSLAEVAPSLLLTSSSESAAFLLGAISSMPAVRAFSLYAGVAVFFNFLLQISAFVTVMSLDARRQKSYRFDILCCIKINKSSLPDVASKDSFLLLFMKKIWAKYVVLHPVTRPIWLFIFGLTFTASFAGIPWIKVGLDQNLALPSDSYLQGYFSNLSEYLHIGAPVYFVIKDGFDYTSIPKQNLVCSGSDCSKNSLGTQITMASRNPNMTRIAENPSIWLDAYFEWLQSSSCCGYVGTNASDWCDLTMNITDCHRCMQSDDRPDAGNFTINLKHFLRDNPTVSCASAGHAAYASAVVVGEKSKIGATYVMTYHTILKDSSDFIDALEEARKICDNLTTTLNHTVFPYSVFYVYYEQYLSIFHDMALNLGVSFFAVFAMTVFLLGLNFWGAFIIIVMVFMIIVHMLGVMAIAGINANAVSLVNLVMTVGIAVEFCSHIVRWFISCNKKTRLDRAKSALSHMGSSVVSGITFTKFLGVFILAFAKSQLFEVYYFRMYISMVFIGAAHGLILLPIVLSFIGPPYFNIKLPRVYPKVIESPVVPVTSHYDDERKSSEKTPLLKS